MGDLTLAELTRFGITPEDEHPHPFSSDYEWWNESVFYDWYDRSGTNAGHCRIGWHPNQHRLWMWLFLYNGSEWVAIEQPRLPLTSLQLPRIAYDDGWGLRFSYDVHAPLRSGRFAAAGFGRVLSGPRVGMILPVAVELDVEAVGAAHSLGQHALAGHSDESYSTSRFEQPIRAHGRYTIGGDTRALDVRGERDHSWGPRWWNMEWTFMAVNGDDYRLQCATVTVPGASQISTGYLHRGATVNVTDVRFELGFHDDTPTRPVSGRFAVGAPDGDQLAGRIESISGAEIDITHTFVPPRRPIYRRALIRVTPDGGSPAIGWLESNRFID